MSVRGGNGRITTAGLQVTSEFLSMDSELHVEFVCGDEGRITTMGL